MASIASAASGLWHVGTTWVGGVVPGAGDVASLTHTVTQTQALTIGDGTTTVAINILSGGKLLQKANITVTGYIYVNHATASYEILDDGTQGTPITTTLKNSATVVSQISAGSIFNYSALFYFHSTVGRRITITADTTAGGGSGGFVPGLGGTAYYTCRLGDVDFVSCGSTSGAIFTRGTVLIEGTVRVINSGTTVLQLESGSSVLHDLKCGEASTPNGKLAIINSTSTAPLQVTCPYDKTTQTRTLYNVTISNTTKSTSTNNIYAVGLVYDNWVLYASSLNTGSAIGKQHRGTRVLMLGAELGAYKAALAITSNKNADDRLDRWIWSCPQTDAGTGGAHYISNNLGTYTVGRNQTTRQYVDGWGVGDQADFLLSSGPNDVKYNVFFNVTGNMLDGLNADSTSVVEHNTCVFTQNDGQENHAPIVISESGANPLKVTSAQSNLFYKVQGMGQGGTGVNWARMDATCVVDYNGWFYPTSIAVRCICRESDGQKTYVVIPVDPITSGIVAAAGTNTTTITNVPGTVNKGDSVLVAGNGGVYATILSVSGSTATVGRNTNGGAGCPGLTVGASMSFFRGYFADFRLYGDAGFGQHDVYADPQFVNPAFTLAAYDLAQGGDGTPLHFSTECVKAACGMDLTGTTATGNVAYLYNAIESAITTAFTPQNTALAAAAHDGTTLGAIQLSAPTGTITSVGISPSSATVVIGATLSLTALVVVGSGSPATTVTWASSNPSAASVDSAGVVTGVALGSTTITATSTADGTKVGTCAITTTLPPGVPALRLETVTPSANATVGGANPPAVDVAVRNAGGGSLTGLAVSSITYGSGWASGLTATLVGGTTAPLTAGTVLVRFQATTGALAVGGYTATVTLSATAPGATGTPVVLTFTFGVGAAVTVRALSGSGV